MREDTDEGEGEGEGEIRIEDAETPVETRVLRVDVHVPLLPVPINARTPQRRSLVLSTFSSLP